MSCESDSSDCVSIVVKQIPTSDATENLFSNADRPRCSRSDSDKITITGRICKRRKPSMSWIWKYYGDCKNSEGVAVVCCMLCTIKDKAMYSVTTGTSTLKRHLLVAHNKSKLDTVTDSNQSTILGDGTLSLRHSISEESKAEILSSLVDFVVDNKQPFHVVESKSFKKFCQKMNNNYALPSRHTLVRSIEDEYAAALEKFTGIM